MQNTIEDQKFTNTNFHTSPLEKATYEYCTFVNCSFAKANLIDINFVECEFDACDFSLAKIANTGFRDVRFIGCKMQGLRFDECNTLLLAMAFENCQLNLASFYKLNLKKTRFQTCTLRETDFTEADLTEAVFSQCDFSGAMFENTILEKADLRTAENFAIDPERNRIKNGKYSLASLPGLLHKYQLIIE